MGRMGRKPVFADKETKEAFLTAIKMGLSNEKACDYAGINEGTIYNWINRGEEDEKNGKTDTIYFKFLKEYKKARSTCVIRHVANITQASENGNWQASAWVLERRFAKDFAVKQDFVDMVPIKIVNDVPNPDKES